MPNWLVGHFQLPARTFTPINIWDIALNKDRQVNLGIPAGHTASVILLKGTVEVNGKQIATAGGVHL